MALKEVGVRELREDLAEHLQATKPIIVKRHGKVVGLYLPVQEVDRENMEAAFNAVQDSIEEMLRQTGMTRGELADALTAAWTDEE